MESKKGYGAKVARMRRRRKEEEKPGQSRVE
jgi:hypothetical protein